MVRAWYMDDSSADQRLPHKDVTLDDPSVNLDQLAEIGVEYMSVPPENYEDNEDLNKLIKERKYTYKDCIECSKEKLPNYEAKLKAFFEEHLHDDEEIRYIVEGSGYFDVRDKEDKWIRVFLEAGDLLILPAGIYHRFTLDEMNFIKAVRLFVGDPVWTPHNRPQEGMQVRKEYVQKYLDERS